MLIGFLSRLREDFSFVRGNLLVLIIGYAIFRFTYSLHSPFQSLYMRALGAGPFLIGLMSSLGSVVLALVSIPGAHIADKYGRKAIIANFTYGAALAYLFYVFAPDWRFILVAIVVSNLSHIYHPALEAMEADSMPPDRRGVGYAFVNVLPLIVAVFSAPMGGLLVERMGLVPGMRIIYGVVFVSVVVVAITRTLFLKETLENPEGLDLKGLQYSFKEAAGSILEAWSLMSKDFFLFTAVMLISAFESPLFDVYLPLYASDVVGVSGLRWGLMNAAYLITTLVVGIPLGNIVDRMGRKRSILLGYLFSTPVIAFLIVSRGFLQMLAVNVLFAVGQAVMFPAFSALRADLIPRDKRGRVMGVSGILRTLATVPSAALFGLLYQMDPALPYILGIALEVVAVLIVVFLVREPRARMA